MKTTATILLFLATLHFSHGEPLVPKISVSGSATLNVQPEILRWEAEVSNDGPQLENVAASHANSLSQVLAKLRELGIDGNELQTSQASFDETRDSKTRRKTGYKASTQITFILSDTSRYKALWLALSKFEEVSIDNSEWDIPDTRRIQLREDARIEAIKAAKAKAQTLAAALDMEVLDPIEISEKSSDHYTFGAVGNFSGGSESSSESSQSFAPGTIKVSASIEVVFQMAKRSPN